VVEDVDYGDVGVDFDGLAVEFRRMVVPLADGVESGIVEERIAGDNFERFDGAVSGDNGVKFDARFMAESDGDARVDRVGLVVRVRCGR